ncbi:hypothetical protein C1646_666840 [Rhizophagus diaphanus]|nr:hypothetical protein C1646_666840 [Rhizophagus diaphanus] [Rhizophagus sp. MUCL 43196]
MEYRSPQEKFYELPKQNFQSSNNFISRELEEKVHNLENEVTNKERIIPGKNEEINKYKEIITNLEKRVRELEIDVTEKIWIHKNLQMEKSREITFYGFWKDEEIYEHLKV